VLRRADEVSGKVRIEVSWTFYHLYEDARQSRLCQLAPDLDRGNGTSKPKKGNVYWCHSVGKISFPLCTGRECEKILSSGVKAVKKNRGKGGCRETVKLGPP